jgi:hypothetical protein
MTMSDAIGASYSRLGFRRGFVAGGQTLARLPQILTEFFGQRMYETGRMDCTYAAPVPSGRLCPGHSEGKGHGANARDGGPRAQTVVRAAAPRYWFVPGCLFARQQ